MRHPLPAILLLLAAGCPGGEPVPIVTDDTTSPDTGDTDTDTDSDTDTDIEVEWDPDDFYTIYDIGPDQEYASPCDIPWVELQAGTMVRIHWQDEPYRCKWAITTEAYENHPLVIMGIPDDKDRLPVISGEDATTPEDVSLFQEDRWVIKVGGEEIEDVATWIYLQDFEVTAARPSYAFTDDAGETQSYDSSAAAIRIDQGSEIHLHGMDLNDANNGLTISSGASDVLVSGSWIHENGSQTSGTTYNTYSEAINVTYEYNRLGPIDGAIGHNLMDRSAGLVVRYNWFDGGDRQIELSGSSERHITGDEGYQEAFVYGNVLVEPDEGGSNIIVHYGGMDKTTKDYRPGTLWFFNNTVLSERSDKTILFLLPSDEQQADARNNVFHTTAGEENLLAMSGAGSLTMADNWLTEGWMEISSGDTDLVDDQDSSSGEDPGFEDMDNHDLRLLDDSPCQGTAGESAAGTNDHPVEFQYEKHQNRDPRNTTDDLGALEG